MPILTLLTDFGTADSYVAEVRGVLLSAVPGATLVDVSHEVAPGAVRTAAYLLGRSWRRFPAGTVHLVVVDPGVGTPRAALAAGHEGHRFVGPDNGALTPILEGAEVVELAPGAEASATFHGRDVFAPAAAALANGAALAALGNPPASPPFLLPAPERRYDGKTLLGTVVHVDRFGNLVTDLTPDLLSRATTFHVEDSAAGPLRRTFADVPNGGLVAYLGSGGTVEIAVRGGSAARRIGVGLGGTVRAVLG
jgi:S-adenosylmethionine hydrolase